MRSASRAIAPLVLLGVAALVAGCDTAEPKPSAGVPKVEGTGQLLQSPTEGIREAVRVTKDYAYAMRAELVKDMQDELGTMTTTLQQLSDEVESGSDAVKADAKAHLTAARDKVVKLSRDLETATNTSAAAWSTVKTGLMRSHEDVKQSVAQFRMWLSDQIAP